MLTAGKKCDQPLGSAAVPLDITVILSRAFLDLLLRSSLFARRLATSNVCVYVSNQIASKKLSLLMSVIFAHGPYRHTKVETSGARSRGSGRMGDQKVETSSFGDGGIRRRALDRFRAWRSGLCHLLTPLPSHAI